MSDCQNCALTKKLRAEIEALKAKLSKKDDMDKMKRDSGESGWTVDFHLIEKLQDQADCLGEKVSLEQTEAVALAMCDLGYAMLEVPNNKVSGPEPAAKGTP
jgi:hypothetical protein